MHRFFSVELAACGEGIDLPAEASRQCARVLKLRPGEIVALFDGSGREVTVRLETVSPAGTAGTVETDQHPDREPHTAVELWTGMPRAEKWEWVLQKGTELGAARFQPLEMARCVARLDAGDWRKKAPRWKKIILEAAEQSGRTRIPRLDLPLRLRDAARTGSGFFLDTTPGRPGLHCLIVARPDPPEAPIRLLIGPEGGIEPGEAARLQEDGWQPASLGPRILRCETAALAALALALDAAGALTAEAQSRGEFAEKSLKTQPRRHGGTEVKRGKAPSAV